MARSDLECDGVQIHQHKLKQPKAESLKIIDHLCAVIVLPVPYQRLQFQYKESFPFVINIGQITDFICSTHVSQNFTQIQSC